jgi:diguanylate cyclase (GGDEF)-like protein
VALSVHSRIRLAFAVVLLLGAALSYFVYVNGRSVLNVSEPLLRQQLGLLETISRLRLTLAAQEPVLYEYYATQERDAYRSRFQANDRLIEHDLAALDLGYQDTSRLGRIRAGYAAIRGLAGKLDETLRVYGSEPVDWDRARELLVDVSGTGRRINSELDILAASSQTEVAAAREATRERIRRVVRVVFAFSLLLGVIAAFVGYFVSSYLSESAEREKLAMFAERNPNPVLRLSSHGELLYANPGAIRLLDAVGRPSESPLGLLPDEVRAAARRLLSTGGNTEQLRYQVGDHALECELHALPTHGVVHCYLADVTDRVRVEAELRFYAYHDTVTGLPNRVSFERAIGELPGDTPAALLLLNIDRFRQLVTDIGPQGADDVLKGVATRLTQVAAADATSPAPQLFRFEGDSFALLLTGAAVVRRAAAAAQAVLAALGEPLYGAAREIFLSASIGTSLAPEHGPHDALFRNAGTALQAAKQGGGGHVALYAHEMTARVAHRVTLEAELRRALERSEFSLNLQPQAELRGGRMIGGEVLLRWQRANGDPVSPAQFIPVAEDTGLILPIGEWVLRHACRHAVEWRKRGMAAASIAVNISARQFQQPGLVKLVEDALTESGLEPAALELEITESSAMHDVERAVRTLEALKALGVALAIDDFGTGFSSLNYLSRFPIDRLKIDQSFVHALEFDASAHAIAAAVVTLGHSLDLRVIAEGVETREQLHALREMGCDEMQGYLYSKPLPVEEFAAFLSSGNRLDIGAQQRGPMNEQPGLSSVV